MKKSLTVKKIAELERQTGMSEEQLLQSSVCDSVTWGICMMPRCDYTTTVDPDARAALCEVCGERSVQSICVIMGVI